MAGFFLPCHTLSSFSHVCVHPPQKGSGFIFTAAYFAFVSWIFESFFKNIFVHSGIFMYFAHLFKFARTIWIYNNEIKLNADNRNSLPQRIITDVSRCFSVQISGNIKDATGFAGFLSSCYTFCVPLRDGAAASGDSSCHMWTGWCDWGEPPPHPQTCSGFSEARLGWTSTLWHL